MPVRPPLLTLPILEGRHELAITGLRREEESFTLHYRITPALPDREGETLVLPILEAEDDLGNEYDDRGGAYGTRPDGTCTDGSLTGRPHLHPDAGTLHIRITWLRSGEEASCGMTLDVRSP